MDNTPDQGWTAPKPLGNNNHFDNDNTRLLVGSIYGARTFLATPEGHLTGVTYKKIWNPGINTAECWVVTGWHVERVGLVPYRPYPEYDDIFTGRTLTNSEGESYPETRREMVGWRWSIPDTKESGVTKTEPHPVYGNNDQDHNLAECHCGLHGYFRGSLDFATNDYAINGIVRAFGKIRLGDRGFRAEHAEITALYVPEFNVARPKPGKHEPLSKGLRAAGKVIAPEVVEAVSERYPAVPIYTDLDDMLALHELVSP